MIDIVCSRQGLQLEAVLISNHAKTVVNFAAGRRLSVASEIADAPPGGRRRHRGPAHQRPGMDLRDIEIQTLAGAVRRWRRRRF